MSSGWSSTSPMLAAVTTALLALLMLTGVLQATCCCTPFLTLPKPQWLRLQGKARTSSLLSCVNFLNPGGGYLCEGVAVPEEPGLKSEWSWKVHGWLRTCSTPTVCCPPPAAIGI